MLTKAIFTFMLLVPGLLLAQDEHKTDPLQTLSFLEGT